MAIKKKHVPTEIIPRNMNLVKNRTGNIYKSITIIGQRAREIAKEERDELHKKLEEFAPASDSLEEVFENKEQIDISTYYEKLPKPTLVATEEFIKGDINFREKTEDEKAKDQFSREGDEQ